MLGALTARIRRATLDVVILVALAVLGVFGFVVVPRIAFALAGAAPMRAPWLPWISAALFTVAWILPNPDIAGTRTFTQHAIGGGAACAVAALFVAQNVGLRSSILRIAFAYCVAASLGTGLELVELVYDQANGTRLTADSSWDLLANSTGAILTAAMFEAGRRLLWQSSRSAA